MIYLDHNATTSVDPEVLEAMLPYLKDSYGNASSTSHALGWDARKAVDIAREQVAGLINGLPGGVIFTSGATEAINLALQGVCRNKPGSHIIAVTTEHKAVLDTCAYLHSTGIEVTLLHVDEDGWIDPDALREALRRDTELIAVMHANNETGVIQDLQIVSEVAKQHNILLFSDTTQSVGKVPVDVELLGVDLACLSAHKMYGPKGVGALYFHPKTASAALKPLVHGGGHEKGLRSGTLNVPGIVGLGKACELASAHMQAAHSKIRSLRDRLESGLMKLGGVEINGNRDNRLANTSNLCIKGVEATMLLEAINRQVAASTGAACTSANPEPSHVLRAMGFPKERVHCSIRFSLGRENTLQEVEEVIDLVASKVEVLRQFD